MLEKSRYSSQTKVFTMTFGIRSSRLPCFFYEMIGCGLDFAPGAVMFGNYCNFGAAQKFLSPAAVHISPADLPIIIHNNMNAAFSCGFFCSTENHVFAGGAILPVRAHGFYV